MRGWFLVLAIVGVMNAAISAAYYLRVVSVMYFRSPQKVLRAEGGSGAALVMSFCAVLVLGIGLYPGPLTEGSQAAASSIIRSLPPQSVDNAVSVPASEQPSIGRR